MDDLISPPRATRPARAPDAERLVLDTITAHGAALLRTARRHSLCLDDAHDAYQRGLEIFLRHADRLDGERAASWLHTVVKHEAMAVRKARQQLVTSEEFDGDAHEASTTPGPDERLESADLVARSAEALQRLKPQEVTALWLQMQGLTYSQIADRQNWSYTKVNRCLTEGRRAFLERYANIESGEECRRWEAVLSAMVDGEADADDLVALRPHLRNCAGCKARVRALRDAPPALQSVLPVGVVGSGAGGGEAAAGLLTRIYETVVTTIGERTALASLKLQAAVEASGAVKATAVAASAVALGAGGIATKERIAELDAGPPAKRELAVAPERTAAPVLPVRRAVPSATAISTPPTVTTSSRDPTPTPKTAPSKRDESPPPAAPREFGVESPAPERPPAAAATAAPSTEFTPSSPSPEAPKPKPTPAPPGEFGFEG